MIHCFWRNQIQETSRRYFFRGRSFGLVKAQRFPVHIGLTDQSSSNGITRVAIVAPADKNAVKHNIVQ